MSETAFAVGDLVVTEGRVDVHRDGADLLHQTRTVTAVQVLAVTTDDGSIWHTAANGGWNLSVRGSKTVYQSGLYITRQGAT